MADLQSSLVKSLSSNTTTDTTIDPYEALKIIHNPNDTLIRLEQYPSTLATDDLNIWKDISLNTQNKTSIRIFRPMTHPEGTHDKLPVVIYFHGGGFILFSTATTMVHNFCKSMATHLSALIVSVDYRLAPENRLPAAYDDAMEAVKWVRDQALDSIDGEPWLRDYADFSKCFTMGCSAGGNIAFHACLRSLELDLEPIKISGVIMNQPFFGGEKRTGSELRLMKSPTFNFDMTDVMWKLSLPIGANRDHFYCNPMDDVDYGTRGKKEMVGSIRRCLVAGCDGDLLFDSQIEFVKMLEGKGVKVDTWMVEGGYHGIYFLDPKKGEVLFGKVKDFIFSHV